jgi:Protein of unknown function (DUF3099)
MRRRRDAPVLITSAATSRPEEIRGRERRYVISMLFRAVCFILAVVAFHGWLRFVAIAIALITPWVAVIVANGGPARQRASPPAYAGEPARGEPHRPALAAPHHDVIEGDPQPPPTPPTGNPTAA